MVACTQLFSFFFLFVLTGYHFRMMSVYLPFLRPLLRFLCSSLRAVSPFRAFYPFVLQRDRPSVYKLDICIYTHPVVSTYACLYLVICSFIYVFTFFALSLASLFLFSRRGVTSGIFAVAASIFSVGVFLDVVFGSIFYEYVFLSVFYSFVFISTLLTCRCASIL